LVAAVTFNESSESPEFLGSKWFDIGVRCLAKANVYLPAGAVAATAGASFSE
jgi:hypothetical protein